MEVFLYVLVDLSGNILYTGGSEESLSAYKLNHFNPIKETKVIKLTGELNESN